MRRNRSNAGGWNSTRQRNVGTVYSPTTQTCTKASLFMRQSQSLTKSGHGWLSNAKLLSRSTTKKIAAKKTAHEPFQFRIKHKRSNLLMRWLKVDDFHGVWQPWLQPPRKIGQYKTRIALGNSTRHSALATTLLKYQVNIAEIWTSTSLQKTCPTYSTSRSGTSRKSAA